MAESIFEKYGGTPAVSKIVHEFYQRITETPSLDKYFSGVDIGLLIDHQIRYMSLALGGPDQYEGRSLKESHKDLKIDQQAFVTVAKILEDTLRDIGVEEADIATILETVGSVRDDIVTC